MVTVSVKKISRVKLWYADLEHSDWLEHILWPIRAIQTSVHLKGPPFRQSHDEIGTSNAAF